MIASSKTRALLQLIRFDKPVGTLLLLWPTLCALWLASRATGARHSRLAPTFWISALTTMLILLGAAVQDSANGKDVFQAFAVRFSLFLAVTIYALLAMAALEAWRARAGKTFEEIT